MACEQEFLRRLRERGCRLTAQREMVLSALHDVEGLATADEILSLVREVSLSVDISTVYRILDLFQELGIVSSVECADGQRRYELLGLHGPHLHLVCQACGKVIGADVEVARALCQELEARYAFRAAFDRLSIPGLCSACTPAPGA